ncbi:hypothetical protein ONS95_004588 [Cadophora gregata]|uniref:uncharacterized protein n=1 Tax=Cadophora gregata TaxID=51156 RepID=UPI0026DD6FCE|nr:uncharacterized protein ONS95_004588 [Cadophora gregata]KAK0105044.1 hypothetical protein ONS96_004449 [Cadophora gregata f. sp. sojae]KAK0106084.1 hypothetical protein ONS95_004588 [Cadophora gregata]
MSRMRDRLSILPPLETTTVGALSFPQFPNLPRELRNRIWRYAAFEKRIVRVIYRSHAKLDPSLSTLTIEKQSRHPAIVHTSKEAREEGKRYYERVYERRRPWKSTFGMSGIGLMTKRYPPNAVYVNFEVDEFHLALPGQHPPGLPSRIPTQTSFNFRNEILQRLTKLTIDIAIPVRSDLMDTVHHFVKLGNIKTLEFVVTNWNYLESQESVEGALRAATRQKVFKFSVDQKFHQWKATNIEQVYNWRLLEDIDLDPWSSIIQEYWSQDKLPTPSIFATSRCLVLI